MKRERSLITYIDYGYVKCNINELMQKNNLTKTQIARRTGIHYQTIERYIENTAIRYDGEILAKLFYVFNCNLNELITYIKPKGK